MFSQKLVVVVSLFPQIFVCASSWGSRSNLAACSAEVRQESISGGRTLLSFLVVLDRAGERMGPLPVLQVVEQGCKSPSQD